MSERSLDTVPADAPASTPTPTIRKRRSTSFYPTYLAPRVELWTARMRKIPSFICNPWDFYEPFLNLGSGPSLVLCNNKTEIRVMRTFGDVSQSDESQGNESQGSEVYCLLEIQHPNFVNICECYLVEDEIFVFTEYVGFSIQDLLLHFISPTEQEIAYIIGQVSRISSFPHLTFADIAGLGWDTIHLV